MKFSFSVSWKYLQEAHLKTRHLDGNLILLPCNVFREPPWPRLHKFYFALPCSTCTDQFLYFASLVRLASQQQINQHLWKCRNEEALYFDHWNSFMFLSSTKLMMFLFLKVSWLLSLVGRKFSMPQEVTNLNAICTDISKCFFSSLFMQGDENYLVSFLLKVFWSLEREMPQTSCL